MNRNILVTGKKGQLGSELYELSAQFKEHTFFFTTRLELDITDRSTLENFVKDHKICTIINCAAYTAVDKAEAEWDLANKINHQALNHLAEISKKRHIQLIHVSTDYVFNGHNYKPYTENDNTDPINIYGQTKLKGEKAIQHFNPDNSLIIRTSWVFSSFGNNFVKTILRIGKEKNNIQIINDQIGTPTYAKDLANFILTKGLNYISAGVGIYHFTNEGICSWYDFAKEIATIKKMNLKVNPISTTDYHQLAKRPYYSVLSKAKAKQDFGIEIPHWKESLRECLYLPNPKH